MSLGFPLIAWGTIEDITAGSPWTGGVGTPVLTSGQTDPFGGTGACNMNDTDASNPAARRRIFTVANAGSQYYTIWCKQGTAAAFDTVWRDDTAGVIRANFRITWSGGVPSASLLGGSGAVLAAISAGAGWYLLLVRADGIVAANSQDIYLYAATNTPSDTGSTYFFWQSVACFDLFDNILSDRQPRDGFDSAQSPGATEDAWTVGRDYRLQALAQWIPPRMQAVPAAVSGWEGAGDIPAVNQGVMQLLAFARDKNLIRFVPDRSACTTYLDSYLADPMQDGVAAHTNGWRNIKLVLRNATVPYPTY